MPAARHTRAATLAAALSAVVIVGMAITATGAAAASDKNCADFTSQVDAQQYLESQPGDSAGLDADGNGEACQDFQYDVEDPTGTGATEPVATADADATEDSGRAADAADSADATDDTSTPAATPASAAAPATDKNCPDFATQAEAQAVLTADPTDPNGLDADNDKVACEDHFGTEAQQVAVIPNGAVNTGGYPQR